MKIGDYVIIHSSRMILQTKFNEMWPQGIFGKIIDIQKRFSPNDGRRFPDSIIIRAYYPSKRHKLEKSHKTTTAQYINVIKIK